MPFVGVSVDVNASERSFRVPYWQEFMRRSVGQVTSGRYHSPARFYWNVLWRESKLIASATPWLAGNARSILIAERVVLNFMQRMSGIATSTKVCATWKNSPFVTCLSNSQNLSVGCSENTAQLQLLHVWSSCTTFESFLFHVTRKWQKLQDLLGFWTLERQLQDCDWLISGRYNILCAMSFPVGTLMLLFPKPL
jgi:Quinolinate phosphoribosyl transferase, N-terminal domain